MFPPRFVTLPKLRVLNLPRETFLSPIYYLCFNPYLGTFPSSSLHGSHIRNNRKSFRLRLKCHSLCQNIQYRIRYRRRQTVVIVVWVYQGSTVFFSVRGGLPPPISRVKSRTEGSKYKGRPQKETTRVIGSFPQTSKGIFLKEASRQVQVCVRVQCVCVHISSQDVIRQQFNRYFSHCSDGVPLPRRSTVETRGLKRPVLSAYYIFLISEYDVTLFKLT